MISCLWTWALLTVFPRAIEDTVTHCLNGIFYLHFQFADILRVDLGLIIQLPLCIIQYSLITDI